MTDQTLDPSRCAVAIFTGTRGLFSPLAHDLELKATASEVTLAGAVVRAVFVRGAVRVVGVVRGGSTRTDVLSAKDIADIEARIDQELFARTPRVEVDFTLEGARATGSVRVHGRSTTVQATVADREASGQRTIEGSCTLSLQALGVGPVKGPLGVFQVADALRVTARATVLSGG